MRFAIFSLLLIIIISGSASLSYQNSAVGQRLGEVCDVQNLSTIDASRGITLDGRNVEVVNCSRLDRYEYPKLKDDSIEAPNLYHFLSAGLISIIAVLIVSFISYRRYQIKPKEIGFYASIAFSSTAIGTGAIFLLIKEYLVSINFMLSSVLVGIIFSNAILLFKERENLGLNTFLKMVIIVLTSMIALFLVIAASYIIYA